MEPIESQNERPKRSRYSAGLKAVAAIVAFAFLIQDVAFAQGGTPIWSEVADMGSRKDARINERSLSSITIPHDAGLTRKVVAKAAEDVIINIQDAHTKLGAQESISRILDNLVKNYSLKLIALEGASDVVDTSLLSSFPIEEVRKRTGRYLLKEGQISAGGGFSPVSGGRAQR